MGGWAHGVLALFKQVVTGGLDFRVTPGSACLPEFQHSLESFQGQGQRSCQGQRSFAWPQEPGASSKEVGARGGVGRRTGPVKVLGQAWGRGGPRSAGRQVLQKQNHLKHLIRASRGPWGQVPQRPRTLLLWKPSASEGGCWPEMPREASPHLHPAQGLGWLRARGSGAEGRGGDSGATATPRPAPGRSPELGPPRRGSVSLSPSVLSSSFPPSEGRLGGSPILGGCQHAAEGRGLASTQCRLCGSGRLIIFQLAAVAWRWPGVSQLTGSPGLLCGKHCEEVWGQRAGRCGQEPEPGLEGEPGGAVRPVPGSN